MHASKILANSAFAKKASQVSFNKDGCEPQILLHVLLGELRGGVRVVKLRVRGQHLAQDEPAQLLSKPSRRDAPLALLRKQCVHARVEELEKESDSKSNI